MEELRRKVRERLKRAEKVRRRGEEGERVRRRRRREGGPAILEEDLVEMREEPDGGGGRVNLGLRVDEMELREEIVRRERRMEESERERQGKQVSSVRARQSSCSGAAVQLENLSILGEEPPLLRGRSRRGSTARSSQSPISQLATIHERGCDPGERATIHEREREGEPEVVIRVTDLCEQ